MAHSGFKKGVLDVWSNGMLERSIIPYSNTPSMRQVASPPVGGRSNTSIILKTKHRKSLKYTNKKDSTNSSNMLDQYDRIVEKVDRLLD